jgi:hypothetical protein
MTVMEPSNDVEPPLPMPSAVPLTRPCFSGDGRPTKRRWAPGGDSRYLARLRNAYAAGRMVRDPWFIAEHGGVEDRLPDDVEAWPVMAPMAVARKLDAERGVGTDPDVEPHWVYWLQKDEARAAELAQARAEAAAAYQPSETRKATHAEAVRQSQRPRRHTQGMATLDGEDGPRVLVQVVELSDPKRMIVRKVNDPDTRQYLIFDTWFTEQGSANHPERVPSDSEAE